MITTVMESVTWVVKHSMQIIQRVIGELTIARVANIDMVTMGMVITKMVHVKVHIKHSIYTTRRVVGDHYMRILNPKAYLDNTKGGRGDRVWEVPPGGWHSPYNGDAALPLGGAQASHPASPLIEGGQTGAQVGRVPRVGRHLCQSPWNLTKSLQTEYTQLL